MSVKYEQPLDGLTVQVWLYCMATRTLNIALCLLVMVHNPAHDLFSIGHFLCRVTPIRPNIKVVWVTACNYLFAGGTELRTDKWADNTRCPWRTFQAGHNFFFGGGGPNIYTCICIYIVVKDRGYTCYYEIYTLRPSVTTRNKKCRIQSLNAQIKKPHHFPYNRSCDV